MRLALEPEAAALFTKEQNICRQEKDGNVELVPFTPGSTLMCIDTSFVYLYITRNQCEYKILRRWKRLRNKRVIFLNDRVLSIH